MKRSLSLICLLASGLGASAYAQTAASAVPNAPSATGTAAAAVPPAPAGPSKVAVIEFQPAVAQTNEGQRAFAELRKKFEPKETQLKQQSTEIDNLKKQLQTAGASLSETERASRLKTIDDKEKSLQRTGEDAQNDYQQEVQQTFAQIAEKVYAVIQTYAAQNGFTLVVDSSASQQQSPALWWNPSSDITNAVIQAYNLKSGVPAPPASTSSAAPASPTPNRPRPAATTPR